MVDLNTIRKVYFIGIGGIGMSALARYFAFHGKTVSGYDKTETVLTKALIAEGIHVHYDDRPDLAPRDVDIVVYTPAIPKTHRELLFYQNNNYLLLKRSDVLGIITNGSFNICVAGTHGKTTISSMVAHILRDSGYGCNAFLGGIAGNYNSNYWSHERNVCVVEADEYDRSFLKLHPDIAVISAMDPDHLDIYGTEESMHDAFIDFTGKIKQSGKLLCKHGLSKIDLFRAPVVQTYSATDQEATASASNIRMSEGSYAFDVIVQDWNLLNVELNMGGLHNVENVTAAIYIAHQLGIEDQKIKDAVSNYRGVKRRFEYILKEEGIVFIDDYAHHPEELRALISGARSLFPDKQMVVFFQPHLYSRTRDFVEGFAEVLDMADEAVLLPIYPARELPIEGVHSGIILERMKNTNKQLVSKDKVAAYINAIDMSEGDKLIITAGAGDIDTLVKPIKELLIEKLSGSN